MIPVFFYDSKLFLVKRKHPLEGRPIIFISADVVYYETLLEI